MNVGPAVRACLIDLDVALMRRLWPHVHPHVPQPASDDEVMLTMHLARMQMKTLPARARAYSKHWLAERAAPARDAWAVGISVTTRSDSFERALQTRMAMEYAVTRAIKDGVDLATEAPEIKRRLALVRRSA